MYPFRSWTWIELQLCKAGKLYMEATRKSPQWCRSQIPVLQGPGVLLFWNEIHHTSIVHGPENMVLPPGSGGIANEELVLKKFPVPINGLNENEVRNILPVIPSQLTYFKTFFTSYMASHTISLISSSTMPWACILLSPYSV